jgi:LDH2 family malate/lactate/ureidoglycolate dehydrogenase
VEAFVGLDEFKKQVGEICRQLRASRKAPGAERIYTPGEKEHEVWLYRKNRGVPFNDSLKKSFCAVKEKLALKNELPF